MNCFLDQNLMSCLLPLSPASADLDRFEFQIDRNRFSPPLNFSAGPAAFNQAFETTLNRILAEAEDFFTERVEGGGVDLEWVSDRLDIGSGQYLYHFYYFAPQPVEDV